MSARVVGAALATVGHDGRVRRVAQFLVVVMGLAGCDREDPFVGQPVLGASAGDVRLHPRTTITAGAPVTFDIEVDPDLAVSGSSCFSLFRWQPGWGPEVDWLIDAGSDKTWSVGDSGTTCPNNDVALPVTLSFTVPQLDDGTYQLTYAWTVLSEPPPTGSDGVETRASYTFELADG